MSEQLTADQDKNPKAYDIASLGTSPALDSIRQDLVRYGVVDHALDLVTYGFTVVPPEKLGVDAAWVSRLRDAVLRATEECLGVSIGDYRSATFPPGASGAGEKALAYANAETREMSASGLLAQDDVFVEAALNPVARALVRVLVGTNAVLGLSSSLVRAATENRRELHSDQQGVPLGAGHIAHLVNTSWYCTDYFEADGPIVMVPGSFRFGRQSLPHEHDPDPATSPYPIAPMMGEAGSLLIMHAGTYHGSMPRTNPGLRVTLTQFWFRQYMRPGTLWEDVPAELIERFPELTAILGLDAMVPYRKNQSVDPAAAARYFGAALDPYA